MPTPANPTALAQQARRSYAERLLGGVPTIVQAVEQGARLLAASVAEPMTALKRREILPVIQQSFPLWLQGMTTLLREGLDSGTISQTRLGSLPMQSNGRPDARLSLVDDDTIEHEILSSRLALAMMDRASWEFTDLRSRMNVLEGREELDTPVGVMDRIGQRSPPETRATGASAASGASGRTGRNSTMAESICSLTPPSGRMLTVYSVSPRLIPKAFGG